MYNSIFFTISLNWINPYSCIGYSLIIVFITEVRTELS